MPAASTRRASTGTLRQQSGQTGANTTPSTCSVRRTSQISAEELTATANLVQSDTYRSFEVYMIVAVVYLALSALYRLGFWAIGLLLFERRRRLGTPL